MRLNLFFLLILGLQISFSQKTTLKEDFKIIRNRIATDAIESKKKYTYKSRIQKLYNTLLDNGSWKDIKYNNQSPNTWLPDEHLKRLELMAIAYSNKENYFYQSPQLLNKIDLALNYWYKKRPLSKNWWHNEISVPKYLGRILVILSENANGIDKGTQNKILEIMKGVPPAETKTGANLIDIATHNVYYAAVNEDIKLMKKASNLLSNEIIITNDDEGLQADYSFRQHGPQQYISGYGTEYLKGAYSNFYIFMGTYFEMPKEKIKILNKFFFDTYISTLRGAYTDYNVEGRGIARKDATYKISLIQDGGLLEKIKIVAKGTPYEKYIDDIKQRITQNKSANYNVIPKHSHFWRSDYTIHNRAGFSFNVRSVSKRTKRTEKGNGENILGRTLADGSTMLAITGLEYNNIMPVWEWDKIPGTTSKDYTGDKTFEGIDWGQKGSTSFTGGVSDGLYGASIYSQKFDNVSAKKAYFFYDNAIVCLGSDIKSDSDSVTTTIEQNLSKGNIYILKNGKISNLNLENGIETVDAIWHNNVGYIFQKTTEIHFSNKIEIGNWKRVNERINDNSIVKEKVFKLWLKHNTNDKSEADYQYIIVPNISKDDLTNNYSSKIKILKNDLKHQIVEDLGNKIIHIIFHKPNTKVHINELSITTDKACIIQIKKIGEKLYEIHIADPNQTEDNIKLTISKDEEVKTVLFTLPSDNLKGQSISKKVDFSIPENNNPLPNDLVISTTRSAIDNTHQNAFIKIQSKELPFMIPRLWWKERENILDPVEGMLIFYIPEDCLQLYTDHGNGKLQWKCITPKL
ncbi:polysaccharide lyase family 8 super-sandwich domain-containing protein [Ornithobacterium rhinotracheale]